jgi:hypothetical protein
VACDSSPGESLSRQSIGTDVGDALGRHILLEVIVEVVFLATPPRFSGGNPRSHAGSGEFGVLASFASWDLALDVPSAGGTSGVSFGGWRR